MCFIVIHLNDAFNCLSDISAQPGPGVVRLGVCGRSWRPSFPQCGGLGIGAEAGTACMNQPLFRLREGVGVTACIVQRHSLAFARVRGYA
jgi:hypothetical protein